ncbi:hypothetical protein LCGC14_1503000 [marine sediment metagenome]|uniref:DUF5675 domain-containing protein n=1 Tax=marine sediment metagenome TaxID=412755 RepID=A0A0F9JPF5_9ZZZZ
MFDFSNYAEFVVMRHSNGMKSTLGNLFKITKLGMLWLSHTIEDPYQSEKKRGNTRIPAGIYDLGIRKVGGFHTRYKRRYPEMHKGMIEIMDVPNFKYVLVHSGNTHHDTAGCLLTTWTQEENIVKEGFGGRSRDAYKFVYQQMIHTVRRVNTVRQRKCKILYIDLCREKFGFKK